MKLIQKISLSISLMSLGWVGTHLITFSMQADQIRVDKNCAVKKYTMFSRGYFVAPGNGADIQCAQGVPYKTSGQQILKDSGRTQIPVPDSDIAYCYQDDPVNSFCYVYDRTAYVQGNLKDAGFPLPQLTEDELFEDQAIWCNGTVEKTADTLTIKCPTKQTDCYNYCVGFRSSLKTPLSYGFSDFDDSTGCSCMYNKKGAAVGLKSVVK